MLAAIVIVALTLSPLWLPPFVIWLLQSRRKSATMETRPTVTMGGKLIGGRK